MNLYYIINVLPPYCNSQAIFTFNLQELKVISDLLTVKYGKVYADACRSESVNTISEKLRHKMSVQSPPKILVEKYLIEIAKNYNVEYTPDEQVMREEEGKCDITSH